MYADSAGPLGDLGGVGDGLEYAGERVVGSKEIAAA
jgi:hypothetical protein